MSGSAPVVPSSSRAGVASSQVIVVGAGLTGLTVAVRLAKRGIDVRLVDAGKQPGGNLRTEFADDASGGRWLLELGPNSFGDASTELVGLARELGIGDRLLLAGDAGGKRWIYTRGQLREVPSSPPAFLKSELLPLSGRLRIMGEPFIPPPPAGSPEESLAEFCDRRLGRAAREKLLTPVVSGIYAGDPEQLGAQSAFPAMVALEREFGSLIRAAIGGNGPPSRGRLATFVDGLAELPAAAAAYLGEGQGRGQGLLLEHPVERIEHAGAWRVACGNGATFEAEHLVLTTPAHVSARLLQSVTPDLAAELDGIAYAPMAVVHVGLPPGGSGSMPDGFGFLVPRNEGVRILGAIASSRLFTGRAPDGHELLTVFTGGALDPTAQSCSDEELREFVLADLRTILGDVAEPVLFRITRWPRAIPQYVVGHGDRLKRIARLASASPGLHLGGNWREGIAMPKCVLAAEALAASIG